MASIKLQFQQHWGWESLSHRASTSSHLSEHFFPGAVWLVTERDVDMAKVTPLESWDKYLQVCCVSCLHIFFCPSEPLPLVLSSNMNWPWKLGRQGYGTSCWRGKGLGTGKQPWLGRKRWDVNCNKRGCRNGNVRRTAAPVPLSRGLQCPSPSPWCSNPPWHSNASSSLMGRGGGCPPVPGAQRGR